MLFLAAEMKRRTTASGDSFFGRAQRFAFSAPGDPHTSCTTCGPAPPCHRLGCFGARWARFFAASRGASERVSLEKGLTPRAVIILSHSFQLLRPFAFELSAPHCICAPLLSAAVVAMASLVHPERFESEVALNLVCNLLDGARRRSPEGSAPAPLSSAISPPRGSCSSSPTSLTGWCCRSRLSSCCC
jgi:hypothetical protein